MRHRRSVLPCALALVAVTGLGCRPGLVGGLRPGSAAADHALTAADQEALAGRSARAIRAYETIVKQHPGTPHAAEALHRLGMLRVEPGSSARDRRTAQAHFRKLAAEYRNTLPGREARAWRNLLSELDRCEIEATKRGADAEKLRQTLDSIRDSDLELEQAP
jgi:hypothetical protein